MRRCVWSRNIKNGCSTYIYDISRLRVNLNAFTVLFRKVVYIGCCWAYLCVSSLSVYRETRLCWPSLVPLKSAQLMETTDTTKTWTQHCHFMQMYSTFQSLKPWTVRCHFVQMYSTFQSLRPWTVRCHFVQIYSTFQSRRPWTVRCHFVQMYSTFQSLKRWTVHCDLASNCKSNTIPDVSPLWVTVYCTSQAKKCFAEFVFKFSRHVVHFLNTTVRHCNSG